MSAEPRDSPDPLPDSPDPLPASPDPLPVVHRRPPSERTRPRWRCGRDAPLPRPPRRARSSTMRWACQPSRVASSPRPCSTASRRHAGGDARDSVPSGGAGRDRRRQPVPRVATHGLPREARAELDEPSTRIGELPKSGRRLPGHPEDLEPTARSSTRTFYTSVDTRTLVPLRPYLHIDDFAHSRTPGSHRQRAPVRFEQ